MAPGPPCSPGWWMAPSWKSVCIPYWLHSARHRSSTTINASSSLASGVISPSNSLTGRASRCSRSNQAVRGIMSGLDSNSRLCRAPNSTKSMCSSFCRSASRRTRCSRSSSSVLAVFCPWRQRRISSRGVPVWRKMEMA